MKVSVVTVVMNRLDHLVESCRFLSGHSFHFEHVVVDWSSIEPVSYYHLPADSRIKIYRVNHAEAWWLSHAYNLAIALSNGEYILKLDADILLGTDFSIELLLDSQSPCDIYTKQLSPFEYQLPSEVFASSGGTPFFARREALSSVNGFNPFLIGWGWDEIDLYGRLFMNGCSFSRLYSCGISQVDHCDMARVTNIVPQILRSELFYQRIKACQLERNRRVSVRCIMKNVKWPSFEEYAQSFYNTGLPPSINPAPLFSGTSADQLLLDLVLTIFYYNFFYRLFVRLAFALTPRSFLRRRIISFLVRRGLDLTLVLDPFNN